MIPHITNEIKERLLLAGESTNADVVITEIGGTTGILNLFHLLKLFAKLEVTLAVRMLCMFIVHYFHTLKQLEK